ncbi:major antigen [Colias croceus]|uniref:major antigen n=1 Tax=Colias crocea TaxID=72248 RepID=UPI001E280BE9|nr:major antigen [Colias croceus]
MSETDDTDVLLLIPPNFFLVPSSDSDTSVLESSRTVVHKPVSCTAQVLGKLVNQVHSLESRLESLELDSNNTLSSVSSRRKTWDSDSFENDRKCFTFPRRRRRKVLRKDSAKESSITSLDTIDAGKKTIPSLKLDNFCKKSVKINDMQSMDGDISSIVSTPSKKNDKLLLHEIDEFLTKVECYESPETRANEETISPENVIKATGDYMINKYDVKSNTDDVVLPSGRTVPSSVLDKYIYLVKNNPSGLQSFPRNYKVEQDSTTKNTQEKQETRSPSVRKLNFSESKDIQPTSTPKCVQSTSTYSESFKPSSNKIYDRATKVLEHYKSQNYSRDYQNSLTEERTRKEDFKMPQMRPFGYENRDAHKMNIDSIDTDLLSLSELWGEKMERGERSDNNKLEEERLKREHCEAMIQQLQRKILEQQEKLAVAIKVDKAKDTAISKLRDAWLKLTGSLDKAEERHRSALEKMTREVDNFKVVAEDAQKKTHHFESELYKALDLAHDYQEKCKQITNEKKELQDNMERLVASKDEVIRNKDKEVEVLKENYETVMRLNKQSTDCVRNLEEALDKEKLEHEMTKGKVNELNQKLRSNDETSSLIQQEKDILKEKVNEERSRCTVLERQLCDTQNQLSEMLRRCDTLENEAKSLRKHLELQKTELKSHYQQQLEEAVLGKLHEFQRQLDAAERDMEAAARSKENSIVDAYNKQIVRIEEQHRLEVNVLEEKQREEIKLCRLQLAQANEKIGLLESKLDTYRRRRGEIASQLHGVMEAQWRQALQILTHTHRAGSEGEGRDTVCTPHPDYTHKVPPLTVPSLDKLQPRRQTDMQFEDLSDSELQHYVKMLLTKPPSGEMRNRDTAERPTSDRDSHERRDRNKPGYSKQPPWKA